MFSASPSLTNEMCYLNGVIGSNISHSYQIRNYGMVWYGTRRYSMGCGVVWGVVWYGTLILPGVAFSLEATSQGTQNSTGSSRRKKRKPCIGDNMIK